MGLLDRLSTSAKDLAVQVAINRLLGSAGSVSDLAIDRDDQVITGILTLGDQATPITLAGWDLGTAREPDRIRFHAIRTGRPLPADVRDLVVARRWYDIPAAHMAKIRWALS